jgi:hypothetical protein
MHSDSPRNTRQLLPLYLACYALWAGMSALAVWLIFEVRPVVFGLAVALRLNPWQVRAIDEFGVVALGLLVLAGVLVLENYLRQGVARNQLWRRAARVLLCEAAALALAYGLQALFV